MSIDGPYWPNELSYNQNGVNGHCTQVLFQILALWDYCKEKYIGAENSQK